MITPKEQALYDRLKTLPNFQEMVTRLGLEPVVSEAHRTSTMVSARVDVLMDEFEKARNSPHKQRTVLDMDSPFGLAGPFTHSHVIKAYLETIYGPQPWKYPLPNAPF